MEIDYFTNNASTYSGHDVWSVSGQSYQTSDTFTTWYNQYINSPTPFPQYRNYEPTLTDANTFTIYPNQDRFGTHAVETSFAFTCADSASSCPTLTVLPLGNTYDSQGNVVSTGNTGTGGTDPSTGGGSTPTPTPTPSDSASGAGLCFDGDGIAVDCSAPSCSTIQTQTKQAQGITTGTCSYTQDTGPNGDNGGLGTDTTQPSGIGDCVDLIPTEFKFDVPCLWQLLFTPTQSNKDLASAGWTDLMNNHEPFVFLTSLTTEAKYIFGLTGQCAAVTVPFDLPTFSIHEDIPLIPCIPGLAAVTKPLSTFMFWIFVFATWGPWLLRKFDFTFNAEGGE